MAINKKLIHFKNKENFDTEVANGNILDTSIVFIQDSKEISTHGTVYKTVNWSVLEYTSIYEFVDLGLPSGLLWATCNVGATSPEGFGLNFAWGETEGYALDSERLFTMQEYKFTVDDIFYSKYVISSSYGTVDNLTTLELLDDAAYKSDKTCRMPTHNEIMELMNNTTLTHEALNGINGTRFTSNTNGNSIFIPCNYGVYGSIWTSDLYNDENANCLFVGDGYLIMEFQQRYLSSAIRPVK